MAKRLFTPAQIERITGPPTITRCPSRSTMPRHSRHDLKHHLRHVDYVFEMTLKRWKG